MELIQSFGQYLVDNPAAKVWFVVIAMSNTMGLVEIFYLARKTTFFKNFNING